MRARFCAAALLLMSGLTAGAQTSSGPTDEPTLPPGPGRELMIRVCSQCHSPDVVAGQQLDRAGWTRVVDQMASQGAVATDAEFDEIVQYLAAAFPASR